MGVPALFRWLSKKYPKIVLPVIEEEPVIVPGADGESETIPVDTSGPNPNGEEFDNLYLDMNGIVHPCTHPEGKPAPKTEEDMMHEVFIYTERVIAMVRPRKLLMIAIDGVAPRAKMNQQRSRRFRSAQEAQVKEEERLAAIKEWEAMGKEVSDEFRNEKGWDSNAITPGTPFMTLLAQSLRYWVAKKLNEDPGWAGLEVIISDASVPGEGEHKVMDFIRRQRSQPSHDPNTSHVIYGLDADLIMLSLATHEPHFRVLREDVFYQDKKFGKGCHTCGQMGHHSAQCTGKPKEKPPPDGTTKTAVIAPKPFIFLDVSILREYLAVELSAPLHTFPFNLERAIDDWVFLIFFVGNDFLPHLPSLEIREGAIDTLMGIWKTNLEKMGGYLAEDGKVNLERAQIILEKLAEREDDIFKRRKEAEERQDRTEKRRKIENENRQNGAAHAHNGQGYVPVYQAKPALSTASIENGSSSLPHRPAGLPPRPAWVTGDAAPPPTPALPGLPTKPVVDMASNFESNASIVANRRNIRMANLSAAQILKAELSATSKNTLADESKNGNSAAKTNFDAAEKLKEELAAGLKDSEVENMEETEPRAGEENISVMETQEPVLEAKITTDSQLAHGVKRKAEDEPADLLDALVVEGDSQVKDEDEEADEDDDADEDDVVSAFLKKAIKSPKAGEATIPPALKLLGNNMVEQEDIVKLWEPGYKERYYRQKFGVELSDAEFRKAIVKSYVEGLCWVLEYYYQGTPSWQWYYPYHFSPFASDFLEVGSLDIQFVKGAPFKPYEQLMGVFPAASRVQLPEPFHPLMTADDSPIKDFYPEEFDIDMNGKKMLWQGVALLPFIDPARLLNAMATVYGDLTQAEIHRNEMGSDVIFVSQDHPLYDYLEGLYTKRKIKEAVELDTQRSKGLAGLVLPNPDCIPGATFDSPLPSLPDLMLDRSMSALYQFPDQKTPHKSALLPGVKRKAPTLSTYDRDSVRKGGPAGGGGGGGNGGYDGFHAQRQRAQGDGQGLTKSFASNRGDTRGDNRNGGQGGYSGHSLPRGGGNGGGYRGEGGGYGDRGGRYGGAHNGYDSHGRGHVPPQPSYGYGGGGYGQSSGIPAPGGYGTAPYPGAPFRGPVPSGGGAHGYMPPIQGNASSGYGYGGSGAYGGGRPSYGAAPPAVAPAYQGYGGYGGNPSRGGGSSTNYGQAGSNRGSRGGRPNGTGY